MPRLSILTIALNRYKMRPKLGSRKGESYIVYVGFMPPGLRTKGMPPATYF